MSAATSSGVGGDLTWATSQLGRRAGRLPHRIASRAFPPLVAIAILLGLWEVSGFVITRQLISSPQQVASDLVTEFTHGPASAALVISLRELYIGVSIGIVLGVFIGVLIGRFRLLDSVLSPYVNTVNATPLNVLIPLLVVWVGIGSGARILFIILITLFPVLLNTAGGLRSVSRGYVDVGRSLGMGEFQLLRRILLPAAMPYIFAGIRVGVALGFVGMVVGEMEVSDVGLGYFINFYGAGFQTGKMLALIVVATVIGLANVLIVRGIQARWFVWIGAVR